MCEARAASFADDAALASHTEEVLQRLMDRFTHACKQFGLTISVKKTNVMGQDVPAPPSISIDNEELEVTDHFTYLGSTVANNLSLDTEISKRIAKAAAVMGKLNKRVWGNNQLTENTKLKVYQACVLSTLLFSSESWTTYARQENRLESFHLRCLRRILGITWQDKSPTLQCWRKQAPSAYTSCFASVGCVGSDMCTAWKMDASPRTSCTAS